MCFGIMHPEACPKGYSGMYSETNSSGILFYAKKAACKFN